MNAAGLSLYNKLGGATALELAIELPIRSYGHGWINRLHSRRVMARVELQSINDMTTRPGTCELQYIRPCPMLSRVRTFSQFELLLALSLSTLHLWSHDLTVRELFHENSFGNRAHCFCLADNGISINNYRRRSLSDCQDGESEIVAESASFVHGELPPDGNGPPKVDSEVEVLHEKVTKQIIKEGHGQKPSKYSTCFLHYSAWTESTRHKFEDTWHEQRPLEMVLGKGWELGYGKEGNFSFPNVPPMADIIYEVELIGFDETKEGKTRSDMTVEERIGAADRRKMDGNALFKDEKLEAAMQQYEMAIAYMGDDFMFQLFDKYRDMALAVKNPCHLNMAACLIKLKRFEEAIAQCSIVLVEDENNAKALFRRGKARAELGQTDAAREDFLKAWKFAPEDKAISKELRETGTKLTELCLK
ncbi:FKBP-type peptidyl-prolyl cis-trans isomerase family protein [Actinidia rufa]|uniref:FKBP-type peptidyl-prolyl cis-trans isomerase family protein n=1 Tax=Actinidia rufa TaxID=165716 RepID=A0A7J0FWZ2_9ERIC|nr:FKBP-type peptidyl-prolyl cis-trans isomerase family protein [Actinidia rufa]